MGDTDALDSALNWYRAAFAGGSTLARIDTPAVAVPTLYCWGNEDMSVGRYAAEKTADFVTAPYQFEEIMGAGHFLAEEFPDRVSELLTAHVRANSES